jgi:hypothetical protein
MSILHRRRPAVHSNPPTGPARTLPADRRAAWSEFDGEWDGRPADPEPEPQFLFETVTEEDREWYAANVQWDDSNLPSEEDLLAFCDWLDFQGAQFDEAARTNHRAEWLARELRQLGQQARALMAVGPDSFNLRRECDQAADMQREYERGFEAGRRLTSEAWSRFRFGR